MSDDVTPGKRQRTVLTATSTPDVKTDDLSRPTGRLAGERGADAAAGLAPGPDGAAVFTDACSLLLEEVNGTMRRREQQHAALQASSASMEAEVQYTLAAAARKWEQQGKRDRLREERDRLSAELSRASQLAAAYVAHVKKASREAAARQAGD